MNIRNLIININKTMTINNSDCFVSNFVTFLNIYLILFKYVLFSMNLKKMNP